MKVVIIGGGASGLVASISAALNGNDVTIIERNNNLGKKILITGNGKCNYWNSDQNISHYHSNNMEVLKKIETDENRLKVMNLFDRLGLVPRIKNGYYYPYSNQASAVQTSLIKEAKSLGVKVINDKVNSIVYHDKFVINMENGIFNADKVILATGSKAYPKTGSDGMGYDFAKSFGHSIIKPLPALVQLNGVGNYFKLWSGIRCDAKVDLYDNGKYVDTQTGEIQLTNYGVSGICIFQLSGKIARNIAKGKRETLKINFLPFLNLNKNEFITWMNKRNNDLLNRSVSELLDSIINYKLSNLILKLSGIDKDDKWNKISSEKKSLLVNNLLEFNLEIESTKSFDSAQVCTGGVPLDEINPTTLESLKQKNLFIVGELLDVDGDCGGYNLGFAFLSGLIAGNGVNN